MGDNPERSLWVWDGNRWERKDWYKAESWRMCEKSSEEQEEGN